MTNHPGPDFSRALPSMPVGSFRANAIPVPQYTSPVRHRIDADTVKGGLLGLVLGLAVVIPMLAFVAGVFR